MISYLLNLCRFLTSYTIYRFRIIRKLCFSENIDTDKFDPTSDCNKQKDFRVSFFVGRSVFVNSEKFVFRLFESVKEILNINRIILFYILHCCLYNFNPRNLSPQAQRQTSKIVKNLNLKGLSPLFQITLHCKDLN